MKSHLEFTTIIGNGNGGHCCVNCKKYCPQEIITEKLKDITPQMLLLEDFKELLLSVPKNVGIIFGGISEPFQNQNAANMVLHAHNKGHDIICFSTLTRLKLLDAIKLCEIPFEKFVIHLPDSYGNAHIPLTEEYESVLVYMLSHLKNKQMMSMDESFISDNHENIFRGDPPNSKKWKVDCYKHDVPDYMVLPNGDVFYCCQCKGLTEKVGNLYENTYQELAAKHPFITHRLQKDPNSICHICNVSEKYWVRKVMQKKNEILGGKTIMQLLNV